jgi:hypothetical protein
MKSKPARNPHRPLTYYPKLRRYHKARCSSRANKGSYKNSEECVHNLAPLVDKPSSRVDKNEELERDVPVVDGAFVIIIIAWQLSIEGAHTHAPDKVIVREDNLALVILGALVVVVAWSTEGWNAHTDAKVSEFRINLRAVAWALVAHSEVEVTVFLTAGCAKLAR